MNRMEGWKGESFGLWWWVSAVLDHGSIWKEVGALLLLV
jgi:hypothetical protein